MYQRIKKLKPVLDKYSAKLIEEGRMISVFLSEILRHGKGFLLKSVFYYRSDVRS